VKLPRVAIALGLVSLLTDMASEMVYPLLPTLLAGLGAGAMALGAVEGVGDATAAVLKLVSGRLSDRVAHRKPLVLLGYALSTVVRPLFAFAFAPWQVVGVRFLDRVGKGIRTSPRDALLAGSVARANAGGVFGFHRAMDNVGATVGPLLVAALLAVTGGNIHTVLLVSVVPGLLAVITILVGVRAEDEPPVASSAASSAIPSHAPAALREYLLILGLFAVVNTSDLFLLRRLSELGVPAAGVSLSWALLNGIRAFAGYPGGLLSDRIGRARSMVAGLGLYAIAYAAMAVAPTPGLFLVGLVGYGFFYGLTEGAERALVASLVPREVLGSAFGKFHLVTGIALLPSNLAFGAAWDRFGGPPCLVVSAIGAVAALIALALWSRRYATE
jgi:MFS family permease